MEKRTLDVEGPTPLSHAWIALQAHLPDLSDFERFTRSLADTGYVELTPDTITLTGKGKKVALALR